MRAPTVRLGEIASLQAGIGFPPALQGRKTGDFPFAKVGDISRCGRSDSSVLSTADHYVDQADVARLRAKLIPAGSILFAKIGEAIRQNHRVVAGCDMLIDNNAMAAIPTNRVDGRFLYNYLKTVDFYALAPATTVPALRKSELETLRVPLPPLEVQRRIAAILDQAETLRTQRRQALAHLDTLTQSLFLDMFGDPVANEMGWSELSLAAATSDIQIGPFGSLLHQEDYVPDGIPLINPMHIKDGKIFPGAEQAISKPKYDQLGLYQLRVGDLVMGRRGEMGRCAIVLEDDGPLMCGTGSLFIRPDNTKATADYLYAVLSSVRMKVRLEEFSLGATMPNLNKGIVAGLKLALPPLSLQQTFATRIQAIEALKATHRSALAQLDALFASLQQRAFAGEL